MGQSTDAILFYGYTWQDEDEGNLLDWWYEEAWNKESPIEIGTHCSAEYEIPYMFVKESESTARRGYPVQIDPDNVASMTSGKCSDWNKQLDQFIEDNDIDLTATEGPGWFLVSYWG
jgi:hypothetical protein